MQNIETPAKNDLLKKAKDYAFGKDVYLLGVDAEGIKYWLEGPKWDCGWYWGFGYVETYQRNVKPSSARDIDSHSHIDSFYGQQEIYDFEKLAFVKGEYINNLYESPKFTLTTFNENEGWQLTELFKTFYHLRKSAELYKNEGGMGVTTNGCAAIIENVSEVKRINEVLIPAVTAAIIKILEPKIIKK